METEKQDIKDARKWLEFTKKAPEHAMARIHVEKLLEKIAALKAENEQKNNALDWIHSRIIAKDKLYTYDEDLLRDIRVIVEHVLQNEVE